MSSIGYQKAHVMNILQVVLDNPNTLDTSLPALWYLRRQHPDAKITILYCVGSRAQVLRRTSFIDRFCEANDITQLDYADFLRLPEFGKKIWRSIFRVSRFDAFPIRDALANPRLFFSGASAHLGMGLRTALEFRLGSWLTDVARYDAVPDADVLLWDHRSKYRFYKGNDLYRIIYDRQPTTFLMPHAPSDMTAHSGISPFEVTGEYFPAFCKYWVAFKLMRQYEQFPDRREDFVELGYPAFDSAWIAHMRSITPERHGRKQCLLLVRSFLKEGVPASEEAWASPAYQEVVDFINRVADANARLGSPLDFVIKPHPKAGFGRTRELLRKTRLTNWLISYEPLLSQIFEYDVVITSYTTSFLVLQMAGLPTILIEDDVQTFALSQWDVLQDLFGNLSLYCRPDDDLAEFTRHALNDYRPDADVAHLRRFFPDNNLAEIDRIFSSYA